LFDVNKKRLSVAGFARAVNCIIELRDFETFRHSEVNCFVVEAIHFAAIRATEMQVIVVFVMLLVAIVFARSVTRFAVRINDFVYNSLLFVCRQNSVKRYAVKIHSRFFFNVRV
jgi:hypothetical protein